MSALPLSDRLLLVRQLIVNPTTPQVTMSASFERDAYPAGDDPVVHVLIEAEVHGSSLAAPIKEQSAAEDASGPPVALFLVLDVSGSMDAPDRYPLLRQALATLLVQARPTDLVGVAVFSDGGDLVLPLAPGDRVQRSIAETLARMDNSPRRFGGATRLRQGIDLALCAHSVPSAVRRTLILTDGEIHDLDECARALTHFRSLGIEVAAYGFGAQFDPASLRSLLSDQLGGWVKPICRLEDIVVTFGHVAEVNARLVAPSGVLVVELDEHVDAGDAWAFRPQGRYLGAVQERRLVRELGGLEAERVYSLLLELRIPPHDAPRTRLGTATLSWRQGDGTQSEQLVLEAPRTVAKAPEPLCGRIADVVTLCEALRRPHDHAVQLRAARARLELAIAEGRDPALIDALRKQRDVLEGRAAPCELSREAVRYLESDESTRVGPLREVSCERVM